MEIYLYQNETQEGPYTADDLKERVTAGELKADDPAWTEASGDWMPLHTLIELPPELIPPAAEPEAEAAPHPYPHLLQEDQDPRLLIKMVERATDLLTRDEDIEFVAIQKHPVLNISPAGLILTSKRVMLVRPKLTKMTFEDFLWRELADIHISEQMLTATLSCKRANGDSHIIDHLPKKQARRGYALAQEKKEQVMEDQRIEMEETRAGAPGHFAGGIPAQGSPPPAAKPFPKAAAKRFPQAGTKQKPAPQGLDRFASNGAPAPSEDEISTAAPSGPLDDPLATLGKLKQMLDGGLIEAHEYEAKKAEILSRM